MSKGSTSARRQNLKAAGFLKVKSKFSRFSPSAITWYDKMREEGNTTAESNTKRVDDSISDQLQLKLNSLKETWKSTGYNDNEVLKLEEAWTIQTLKDKENLKEDKKLIKSLRKEASESLQTRKNANN
jgi:hypothetical protein